jgi:hypothetical protein
MYAKWVQCVLISCLRKYDKNTFIWPLFLFVDEVLSTNLVASNALHDLHELYLIDFNNIAIHTWILAWDEAWERTWVKLGLETVRYLSLCVLVCSLYVSVPLTQ